MQHRGPASTMAFFVAGIQGSGLGALVDGLQQLQAAARYKSTATAAKSSTKRTAAAKSSTKKTAAAGSSKEKTKAAKSSTKRTTPARKGRRADTEHAEKDDKADKDNLGEDKADEDKADEDRAAKTDEDKDDEEKARKAAASREILAQKARFARGLKPITAGRQARVEKPPAEIVKACSDPTTRNKFFKVWADSGECWGAVMVYARQWLEETTAFEEISDWFTLGQLAEHYKSMAVAKDITSKKKGDEVRAHPESDLEEAKQFWCTISRRKTVAKKTGNERGMSFAGELDKTENSKQIMCDMRASLDEGNATAEHVEKTPEQKRREEEERANRKKEAEKKEQTKQHFSSEMRTPPASPGWAASGPTLKR